MPKYTAMMEVPPTATNLDPVTKNLKVSQGRIALVSVIWTPGSQWLNCFRVLYEGGQIIPSEGSGQCRGDGYPDVWKEHIILDKPHPTLNLEAWSDGNNYSHDVLVSIIILPTESMLEKMMSDFIAIVKRLIGL